MIIESQELNLPDGADVTFQLVDGNGFEDTYKRRTVYSCMVEHDRYKRTGFYTRVPGLKLVRLLDQNASRLVLRALLWEARLIKDDQPIVFLDRIYSRPDWYMNEFYPNLSRNFTKWFQRFDYRFWRAPRMYVPNVKIWTQHRYPYLDTFKYMSEDEHMLMTTKQKPVPEMPKYRLRSFIDGRAIRIH